MFVDVFLSPAPADAKRPPEEHHKVDPGSRT